MSEKVAEVFFHMTEDHCHNKKWADLPQFYKDQVIRNLKYLKQKMEEVKK